eukprot:5081890-Prorocentrum_lima.AAC.1
MRTCTRFTSWASPMLAGVTVRRPLVLCGGSRSWLRRLAKRSAESIFKSPTLSQGVQPPLSRLALPLTVALALARRRCLLCSTDPLPARLTL